jgi:hypothetical protein
VTKPNRLHIFLLFILCTVLHFAGVAAPDSKDTSPEIKRIDSLNELAYKQKRFEVAKALNNLFNAENLNVSGMYPKGLAITYLYEGGIFNQMGQDTRAYLFISKPCSYLRT